MLIIGARGMAKEVFGILHEGKYPGEIFFYDDVSENVPAKIYGALILTHLQEAEDLFKSDNNFVLGLGNPVLRKKMTEKFTSINGQLNSVLSSFANIGKFGNVIEKGCTIMQGVTITNDVFIGKGTLVNVNASISHDSKIGDYTEISPGACITGRCNVGNFTSIGTNATILPDIRIGNNVVVGAGAVVTHDVSDHTVVKGVPAKPVNKAVHV